MSMMLSECSASWRVWSVIRGSWSVGAMGRAGGGGWPPPAGAGQARWVRAWRWVALRRAAIFSASGRVHP